MTCSHCRNAEYERMDGQNQEYSNICEGSGHKWTAMQCTMHVTIHLYTTRMSGDMGMLCRIVKEHLCLHIFLKAIVAPIHYQISLGTSLHCLFVCGMTCPQLHR